jgi:hypothetical protein
VHDGLLFLMMETNQRQLLGPALARYRSKLHLHHAPHPAKPFGDTIPINRQEVCSTISFRSLSLHLAILSLHRETPERNLYLRAQKKGERWRQSTISLIGCMRHWLRLVVKAGSLIYARLFGIDTRGISELLENSSIRGNTRSGGLPSNFGRPVS